ncbi:MAG: DUF4926 domain-containing protein [Pyrinomonadaceae bacterium]
MRNINLFDSVVLLDDIPGENLERGNVGAIVHVHNDGEAFEVEFVDTDGHTYGLLPLTPNQFIVLSHEAREKIAA